MKGGFIGTLLVGLAGSLLPGLLGGKGLYRAGSKPQGKGLYRAGRKPKKTLTGKTLTNHYINEYFDKKLCYPTYSVGKVQGQ